jgi:hypothetical protein
VPADVHLAAPPDRATKKIDVHDTAPRRNRDECERLVMQSHQDACPVTGCSVGLDDSVDPKGISELDLPHPDRARVIKGAGLVRVRRLVRARVLHELTLYRPALRHERSPVDVPPTATTHGEEVSRSSQA